MSWTARSVFWILLFAKGVWCLSNIQLQVPNSVFVGDTIRLTCLFDLEGDTLYSVKWYRNIHEFFAYIPSERPPKQYFQMENVRVDMENSGNNFVTLEDVDLSTSGEYRCEVWAEAPSFQMVAVSKQLTVQERRSFAVASTNRMTYGLLPYAVLFGVFTWWQPIFHLTT